MWQSVCNKEFGAVLCPSEADQDWVTHTCLGQGQLTVASGWPEVTCRKYLLIDPSSSFRVGFEQLDMMLWLSLTSIGAQQFCREISQTVLQTLKQNITLVNPEINHMSG